jgi:hypothetical protein
MKAAGFSETFVTIYETIWRHNPESHNHISIIVYDKLLQARTGRPGFPPEKVRILSSTPILDQNWERPSLLSSGYLELFPWGYSDRSVKLTDQLHVTLKGKDASSL